MANSSRPRGKAAPPAASDAVAHFYIHLHRLLDAEGRAVAALPEFARDRDTLAALYRAIVLTRTFDSQAISLQRTGRLGTFASSLGQEAISVAVAHAMRPEDVLLPMYREQGAQILRGVPMTHLLLYWGGYTRGMDYPGPRNDFPVCIPIASQTTHAVGVAYALQYRAEPRVAVCMLGDGSTSKGDFYEAINAAGIWNLPVVFVVSNNQWAISVPRRAQSRAQTLAQKAVAAGIPGEQVDGNDVIAMRDRMAYALERAREGGGPAVVEAVTYRLSDHTTADDASRYRSKEELEEHRRLEPLLRLRRHLELEHGWVEADATRIQSECEREVSAAVDTYLAEPPPDPTDMLAHLYAEMPRSLAAQLRELTGRDDG